MIIASIFFAILYIGIIAFYIICMWKIFVKAGKPGWAAIIPFYNIFVEIEITGLPWWVFLLVFIPGANVVALILISVNLATVFGKSTAFAIGLIFLGFVFIPILAFDDSKYIAPAANPPGSF
ncbi:MAG: signal peptidase I [Actinobacteria bacterium]|nr:signal peptidase I [Actinomycetota bacterium]